MRETPDPEGIQPEDTPPHEETPSVRSDRTPVAKGRSGLPPWLRTSIVGSFAAGLLAHIAYDASNTSYEGASTSLMLGGIVGAALSLDEYLRRGNGGGGST